VAGIAGYREISCGRVGIGRYQPRYEEVLM
jgi:hypothetical protein